MGKYTKRQHYVQQALIKFWASEGMVEVARKESNGNLVKEKSKAAKSVFCENHCYEQVYGFESADDHGKNGFATRTDDKHIFRANDGEQYCKRIEDLGFPVIKQVIDEVNKKSEKIVLSDLQKENLHKYLVLQALRTPGGRCNYQHDYIQRYIKCNNENSKEVLDSFVSNWAYLWMLGVYDEVGLADGCDMPKSSFSYLLDLITGMNEYILKLCSRETQFILGDNPCVFLGKEMNVWGLLMPLAPSVSILMLAQETSFEYLKVVSCTDEWLRFEIYSQYATAKQKIAFRKGYGDLKDIEKTIHEGNSKDIIQNIWNIKDMISAIKREEIDE